MNSPKTVIVSGGSRGIGQAFVSDLLNLGWRVATFSRSDSAFVRETLATQPDVFHWAALDARDGDQLKAFVRDCHKRFGGIDGLVNNAGINLDQILPMTSDEQIDDLLDLNLKSSMLLTRAVTRVMLARNQGGSIINISSIIGHRGYKGTSVYAATKAALDGFSRALARELGNRNIRVNSLSPGFIETDMTHNMPEHQRQQIIRRTPLGRLGKPSDLTGLVAFLLSDASAFLTGQSIIVDGGLTC